MNLIPSSLSSPFISVSTFPSHAHLFLEQLDFCIMLLNARTSSSVIFSSGICI